ncbi:hypothetical protein L3X38_011662 [Prunus dulcis]|uniref:Uncharacterized protein n=1 Tax=Prunus dulcis TaxID=3755 RepID=A0AAD4WKA3_PRUDU|nr:hypothetical protein L3X38_011662 [Prunus dulcis]
MDQSKVRRNYKLAHGLCSRLWNHYSTTPRPRLDFNSTNGSLPFLDNDECIFFQSCQPFARTLRSLGPLSVFDLQDSSAVLTEANNSSPTLIGQEMWDNSLNNCRLLPHVDQLTSSHRDPGSLNCISNSSSLRDFSDESNNQSGIYGTLLLVVVLALFLTLLFSTLTNADFHNPSDCLDGNLCSSRDLQSQFTSARLGDSQAFSRQDQADNSGHANKLGSEVIHI